MAVKKYPVDMFFFWIFFGSWEPIEVAIDFRDFPAKM
jgi:hypothetical protein